MLTRFLGSLTAGSFLVSGLLYAVSIGPMAPVQAESLVAPEAIDLGDIPQWDMHPFTFEVRNTTSCPVTIVNLVASCGCTWLADVKGRRLDPNEVLPIRGTLKTEDRRGSMESHAVLSYRTASAGPDRNLILTVRARIRPTIRATPELPVFKLDPEASEPMAEMIEFDSHQLDSFSLFDASTSDSWITAEIINREFFKDGTKARPASLRITVDPKRLPSEYWTATAAHQSVRVRTTAESSPMLVIPILVRKP